ncbi:uncharacterized protein CBL_07401 [Carabus blaptoides fortunei]
MKLTIALIAVVLIGIATAGPAKSDAKKNVQNKPCLKTCDLDYKPVCAGEGKDKPKSFGSVCVLDNYNCEHGSNLKKVSEGECPGGGGVRLS